MPRDKRAVAAIAIGEAVTTLSPRRPTPQRPRGQQQKCERLLQIEADRRVGVARIADRDVLADMQVEIAAARRQDEGAGDRRGPDDLAVDERLDMLQDRIAVVAGFATAV